MRMNKYDSKAKLIGVTGKTHDSAAEAKASFKLYEHGWLPCTQKFPQTFLDPQGMPYSACPDFHHVATGFYAEFKAHRLNGKGHKQRADAAMNKVDADIAQGYLTQSKRPYKSLEHAWNHSIETVACKTAQLPSHTPLVLIYDKLPDENEEARCANKGILMLTLDTLHTFNSFLLFASLGLDVQFSKYGRRYGIELTEEAI